MEIRLLKILRNSSGKMEARVFLGIQLSIFPSLLVLSSRNAVLLNLSPDCFISEIPIKIQFSVSTGIYSDHFSGISSFHSKQNNSIWIIILPNLAICFWNLRPNTADFSSQMGVPGISDFGYGHRIFASSVAFSSSKRNRFVNGRLNCFSIFGREWPL